MWAQAPTLHIVWGEQSGPGDPQNPHNMGLKRLLGWWRRKQVGQSGGISKVTLLELGVCKNLYLHSKCFPSKQCRLLDQPDPGWWPWKVSQPQAYGRCSKYGVPETTSVECFSLDGWKQVNGMEKGHTAGV